MNAAVAPESSAVVRFRVLWWLPVIAVVALAIAAALLKPDVRDLAALVVVFAGLAGATAATVVVLARSVRAGRSIRSTVLVVALAAVAVVLVSTVVAAQLMFLSPHDLRLLVAVLVLAGGLGVVAALAVADPLSRDARMLGRAAQRVGSGDLAARSGVERADEIGAAARAFDEMAARLEAAEAQRSQLEDERRLLLTSLSHDLRTPLTALRAAVEALEDGVATDVPRMLASMVTDLDALTTLIADLALHARLEAHRFERVDADVDMAELADEAVEAVQPLARRAAVTLRLEAPERLHVRGAWAELGRVVRNLLDNAVRHSPTEAVVTVTLGAEGGMAVLRVHDEGPGFPSDLGARAFEPFTRGDPARGRETGSSGLGLAIARGLVEAHGGDIAIEEGSGATVRVRLPLHAP